MTDDLDKICILIPSLDPDESLPIYISELVKLDFKHIVLVDDGSALENKHIFDELKKSYKQVTLLTHEVNKGKGAALKTGIKYITDNMLDVVGIVTADADGQHSPADTLKVANRLLETNTVVFGTRNFNEDIVPFKSRNGNKITTKVFKLLYGKTVNDTQTGLRGLPIEFTKDCLNIKGDRFEYEIAMLIKIVKDGYEIYEEPIETIYINSNRATHFNTFKDSFKIYKVMFKEFIAYSLSSLSTTLIDALVYAILVKTIFSPDKISSGIAISSFIARAISSLINYFINKTKVFNSNENTFSSLIKYFALVLINISISSILVTVLYNLTHIDSIIIKVVVDTCLFFLSYKIQKKYIFK